MSTCTVHVLQPDQSTLIPCGAAASDATNGYDADGIYVIPAMCPRHAQRLADVENMVKLTA